MPALTKLDHHKRRVLGAHTNNRGELQAICDAFKMWYYAFYLKLCSDSMYSINSIFQDGSLDDPKAANRDLIN